MRQTHTGFDDSLSGFAVRYVYIVRCNTGHVTRCFKEEKSMARFVDDRSGVSVFGHLTLGISDFVSQIRASWAWSAAFRETHRELTALSNRELDDLGIARGEIAFIAREAADKQMSRS